MSAAQAIRRADRQADITMLSSEPEGYYSRPGLAYFLAREIPERNLFPFSRGEVAAMGIRAVTGTATGIDLGARVVTLEGGAALPYDRLLLATGSSAVPIGVPGSDLDGVVKLDDLSDARDIVRRSRSAGSAVVVGGGITALEIVEGLRARGVKVHYLMRKDRYWANVLSDTESDLVEAGLEAGGVRTHKFAELARILGKNGRVTGIETNDGTTIPCGMVAVAVGVLPRKELAKAAGLECSRGIIVDEYLRSGDPDVYAAGDIAEAFDASAQHRTVEVLWNSAVSKGRVAGANMAGGPTLPYVAGDPLNVTRLAGYTVTIIGSVGGDKPDADVQGVVRGDSEAWQHSGPAVTVESRLKDAHVRLALANGAIAGAVVVGDQSLSLALQQLVVSKVDVSGIAEDLVGPDAPVDRLIDGVWRDWRSHNA